MTPDSNGAPPARVGAACLVHEIQQNALRLRELLGIGDFDPSAPPIMVPGGATWERSELADRYRELTGRIAPGTIQLVGKGDRIYDELAWWGYLNLAQAELGHRTGAAAAAAKPKAAPRKVDPDAEPAEGEVKSPSFGVGEVVDVKGWKWRVVGHDAEGMKIVPLGPAAQSRAAHRRQQRGGR